jgi:hypothetical protein
VASPSVAQRNSHSALGVRLGTVSAVMSADHKSAHQSRLTPGLQD